VTGIVGRVAPAEPPPAPGSLIACLLEALRRHAQRPLLTTPDRDGGADRTLTGGDLIERVARAARGLRELGLRPGDRVLLWSENRERWLVADLALLALGCPDVPRGIDAPAQEIEFIVRRAGVRVALVERPELLARLSSTGFALDHVVLLSGAVPDGVDRARVRPFDALLSSGDPRAAVADLEAEIAARGVDEIATVVFTSGTTGRPKGVVLTQGNLASNLRQVLEVIDFLEPGGTLLSILPPWHMFERMVEYALLSLGLRVVYSDRRHFARDLARFRPQALAAVPRLWLLLMEGVRSKVAAAPRLRRGLVGLALRLAEARERPRRFAGAPRSPAAELLAPLDLLLRRLVLRRIAVALGIDRLRRGIAISGGGTLPDHVDLFFAALGVPLVNGYGLTETSPVLTLRPPWRDAGGTVGSPLAQTEISIRDPERGVELPAGELGVIHARGPQVMRGYLDDPEATAAVLSHDGWFDTGDLGRRTPAGDLEITGRAKDTIVLLSGENVEPEPIENALLGSPLIEQAIVVGQDRKHLAALLVPRRREGEPPEDPAALHAALRREIEERVGPRRGFRSHERIVRFHVLPRPLTLEEGFLSQTLKIRRNVVHERLAAEIDALYRDDAGAD